MPAASPSEIKGIQAEVKYIPDVVFEVVNDLLARASGNIKTIKQKDVVARLEHLGVGKTQMLNEHWLDFEPAYRAKGWSVTYDKPGYNETYDANWVFQAQ